MTTDLIKLKALATAAAANQYDAVALNDYGTAVPPATVLGLIAEIERHRLVNAEGCKPDSNIQLSGLPCVGAAPCRSLDKTEGCKPDLNNSPFLCTLATADDKTAEHHQSELTSSAEPSAPVDWHAMECKP